MSVTVTSDAGTFTPALRLTANETIKTRNVVHELLGGGVAVTFGGEGQSTTTLEFVFKSESAANMAFNQLNTGHLFQITDTNKPTTSQYFSVAGNITRSFVDDTADVWIVTVDVQEVTP